MSRDERDDYRGDVIYDVWRSGGNPDRVDYDRCDDAYYRGIEASHHAETLLREAEFRRQQSEEARLQQEHEYDQYLRGNIE